MTIKLSSGGLTAAQTADAILNRKLDSTGDGTDTLNERTVRSALRAMRNKVVVSTGNMTVFKEDDTNTAWTGTLSSTADITVDPA
jgi:peptidyl-tRNA hydrolase